MGPPPMGGPGPMPMGPGPMHPMDMGPPPMQQQAVSNVVFVSNVSGNYLTLSTLSETLTLANCDNYVSCQQCMLAFACLYSYFCFLIPFKVLLSSSPTKLYNALHLLDYLKVLCYLEDRPKLHLKCFIQTKLPQLAYEITPKFVREQFKSAGEVLRVSLERDRDGKSKGFGTVTFAYPDMALRCIDMFNQKTIKGRRLSVKLVSYFLSLSIMSILYVLLIFAK